MRNLKRLGLVPVLLMVAQCSTPSGSGEKKVSSSAASSGPSDSKAEKKADDVEVTGNFKTFSYSLSNNRNTSYVVDKKKAAAIAEDISKSIKKPTLKDRRELIALMAVKRLAGASFEASLKIARTLVELEMKQAITNDMPEVAKLELALAAIEDRKLAYADFFLDSLRKSKNKAVLAAVANADGIIHLLDGKLPEAVDSWNEALKIEADYRPALVNIGFTALKYGDYKTAQRTLSGMQDDWFALSGLVVAERYSGDAGRASALCDKVLSKKPNYKPALLSCALNEYQGHNKDDAALVLLNKITKIKDGSSTVIDEEAFKVISMIEKDKAADRAKAASDKARRDREDASNKAAAAAKEKEQQKPSGGGAAAGGGQDPGTPAPQGGGAPAPAK